MSEPCVTLLLYPDRNAMFECGHAEDEHDEDGCEKCDCMRYRADNDPSDSMLVSIGDADSRATYRSQMREAGRSGQLGG